MSTIQNPFINYNNVINHIDNNNTNIILTFDNIKKYYSDIYVIIKKNDNVISSDFYNNRIDKNIFDNESNNLILYKVTNRILNNTAHYNNLVILSNIFLEKYNIFSYKLEDKNLILPIFTISFNNFLIYLKQYDNKNSIEDIIKIKIMNNYFNFNNNLISIINNLNENLYWQNFYNCNINFTKIFINRMFTFKLDRLDNQSISIMLKKLIFNTNIKIQNIKTDIDNNDYLKEIEINSFNNINTYSSHIFKNYIIPNYNYSLTKEDINKLFDIISNTEKLLLFSNLLVSKKYCHIVLNNYYILSMMLKDILLYGPLFRYLLSYTFIQFYIEEIKRSIFIKTTDSSIFDINTASLLPVYPISQNIRLNPYMTLLIDEKHLNLSNTLCGMLDYNSSEINNKGICNLEEFKYRLNIFCSGDDKINIFKNIDFNKYNIAITGSTMTACIQKKHPLMSLFKNTNIVNKFNDYFDEYYSKSDIDIMFKIKNIYEYIDTVKLFFNDIKNNLNSFYINLDNIYFNNINSNQTSSTYENIKLVLNKINYLFVTEKYIIDNINIKHTDNKIQYIKNNINSNEIIEIFRPIYKKLIDSKLEEHLKFLNNDKNKYNDIFINNDNFKIYIINKSKNNEVYIDSSYKYNIISPYLKHSLELFQIKTNSFLEIVSKFHLPCVRAYYDGTNLYMTTLCVISHLTYINIDYKYMHGNKDPFEILIKNHMRGFGTILTNHEKKLLELYIKEIPYYSFLYKNIFGPIEINSKLYKPTFYNIEYFYSNINNSDNIPTNNVNFINRYNVFNSLLLNKNINISDEIKNRFNSLVINNNDINYDNIISINKNGNIIPFQKWIIDYTFNNLKNIDN